MKLFLKRVMCCVGLHKWKYKGYCLDKTKPNTWTAPVRYCDVCNKSQESHYDKRYKRTFWSDI